MPVGGRPVVLSVEDVTSLRNFRPRHSEFRAQGSLGLPPPLRDAMAIRGGKARPQGAQRMKQRVSGATSTRAGGRSRRREGSGKGLRVPPAVSARHADIGRIWAGSDSGQRRPNSGRFWPNRAQRQPYLGRVRPTMAEFDQTWAEPRFGRIWADLVRCHPSWPSPAKVGPTSAKSGPSSAKAMPQCPN